MMSDILEIKHLLSNVAAISKKYVEIAKVTGEGFNIFSVMGMESDEVYTHSAIITELLNPKGSHGQGSVFLKLFFENITFLNEIEDFDFNNATVLKEEHIGLIDEFYTKGGYIDIVIKDDRHVIVIENKIFAGDQPGQLIRYKNYYKDSHLIYLTLDGSKPSRESLRATDAEKSHIIFLNQIIRLSYNKNIITWLEACHKSSIDIPMLREVIKQYINLIKKLTHQTQNNKMKEEIRNLITGDVVELIDSLHSELQDIIIETKSTFFENLSSKIDKVIFINGNKNISVVASQDNDGIFVGYQYFISGNNCSNSTEAITYRDIMNLIREIKNSGSYFAWYNPINFKRGIKFENLDKKEIIKMYKDSTYLNQVIDSIVLEEKNITEEFLKRINNNS